MPPLAATKYLRAQSQEQVTAEEYSAAVSSLTTAGVRTTHDLLLQPDLLPGIPHSRTLHTLRQLVAAHHAAPGTTAFSQLTVSPVAPLSTTIPALDDLLHGGVGFGAVTEVLGAAGCGRTRMATLLAMQLVRSHPSALVYYVHSDAMPLGRLHGSREQLERVLAVECRTMDRLLSFLYGLAADAAAPAPQDDAPRLVVVDNVRDLAVAELQRTGDAEFSLGALRRALRAVVACKEGRTAVVVVNGVRAGGECEPALGFPWSQVAHVRVLLQCVPGVEARTRATVLRATAHAAQRSAEFSFFK